jgi:hypothetical protein
MLASVAFRISTACAASRTVQLQQIEGVDQRMGLVPPMAQELEGGQAVRRSKPPRRRSGTIAY